MAQTIREDGEFSIKDESAWGVTVLGSSVLIPVTAGEWIHENVGEERDEMVRATLARDFNSVPTVRSAEGSVGGLMLPVEPWHFLDAILGGTETKTNLERTLATAYDTLLDVHEFTIGRDVRPLTIQQADNVMTGANKEIYTGMLVNSFTMRGATGEGALEWEAELVGQGRLFAATPKTVIKSAHSITKAPLPLVGSFLSVDIGGVTTPRLLDFEIVFSREIELAYGADSTMIPNIRRQSAPRITFRATIELQLVADIQKYAADVQSVNAQTGTPSLTDSNFTGFESNLDTWHFRIATVRSVNTATEPKPTTTIDPTNGHAGNDTTWGTSTDKNRAMIDIFLDRVSYGEAPILIDRSEQSATFEFRGVALYDGSSDARLGVFRVTNEKTDLYSVVT